MRALGVNFMYIQKSMFLRSLGVLGTSIFAFFFILTFSTPGWVESFATDFIESQVTKKIDRKINRLAISEGNGNLSKFAQSILAQNENQIEDLQKRLKSNVHTQMTNALSQIRNLSCECRKKWEDSFRTGIESNISLLQVTNEKITDFIQSSYMAVVGKLKKEIRIFTGANAAVFLLLLIISFLKPKAITHLYLPAILISASTVICAYFYIFEQNWLLTIIYSDYLGFIYLIYLGVVFVFLCDIVLNRGRVTTQILNAALQAAGSVALVVPC
jgi:hypothetical protein